MAKSRSCAAAVFLIAAFGLWASSAFVGPVASPGNRVGSLRAIRSDSEIVSLAVDNDAQESAETTSPFRLLSAAVSILAALALAVLPMEEAQAARSGGRIGGSAPRARPPPPRPSPPPQASSSSNTTVINKTTIVSPPPVMGGGYGYGGMGVVVAPPPTLGDVVVGSVVGGAINNAIYGGSHSYSRGPSSTDMMLQNQQNQDERKLDDQARQIEQLKNDLASLKATSK
eukprot:TRINITY_DN11402_c1_g3_i1.p1 TRINITY_DN11402_c1_g3~~TRINITY_DN11402_c1_g3_i1.p1  ORF type:complete len:228 (+),score=63.43 TRINITY_DN11402_c1_g3_i1:97-780(+)